MTMSNKQLSAIFVLAALIGLSVGLYFGVSYL